MTTSAELHLTSIGQIAVNAHDLSRATEFYRETLGMRFLFSIPQASFFDCGGIRLMLGLPENAKFDHPASIIYYKVDDIQAVHETLVSRGVAFEGPPHLIARMPDHELWMAFFDDSEGNVVGLMEEKR